MTENNSNLEPVKPENISATEVRQWRVGTISMGLALLALGLVLLLGRFSVVFTLSNLLKFWPLVLIILGLEMVLLNLLAAIKGGKIRFTYDVLSIFLVLTILLSSTCLVALESTGVLDYAQRALKVSQRYVESEKVLSTADKLKSLTLDIDQGTVNLRTYEGSQVKVSVIYSGWFASREEAGSYAEEQTVTSQRGGDTLFIRVYPLARNGLLNGLVEQEVNVPIPRDLDVNLVQVGEAAALYLQDLQGNWVVRRQESYQALKVFLEEPNDVRVQVELAGNGQLRGNVDWDSEVNDESGDLFTAEKVWGEDSYTLMLFQNGGTVDINTK